MNRWPWISLLLAAAVMLNPLGLEIIDAAFFSGEALSRSIWRPIVLGIVLVLALAIALEWWIRRRRAARRPA